MAVPSDKITEIARRYQAGETQTGIASSLDLDRSIVRRVLDLLQIPLRPQCPASGPHRQAILEIHADGKSIKEISTQLAMNFATVYRVLRRAGRVQKMRP
ncbi:MAG: hypothetical protein JWO38_913 [Gemmataceae bacterium]|nr:hypothetical protein [Gemmataceae bacterium]